MSLESHTLHDAGRWKGRSSFSYLNFSQFALHPVRVCRFFDLYPALFYGFSAYLGASLALFPHVLLVLPLLLLLASGKARFGLALCVVSATCFLTFARVAEPKQATGSWQGEAMVSIEAIDEEIRYGKSENVYTVRLHSFQTGKTEYRGLLCKMRLGAARDLLEGGCTYTFFATLNKNMGGRYSLVPRGQDTWKKGPAHLSLVSFRHSMKRALQRFLAAHMPPGNARSFLEGCLSGTFHDLQVSEALRRYGLQHIIVVSGFHFSLVAFFTAALMSCLFSWRTTAWILFFAVTGYFLFIGPTPSVIRAYIAVVMCLAGQLMRRSSSGLNALGTALLVMVIYDPMLIRSLSFQLSFLATFSLLLFYPLLQRLFKRVTSSFTVLELVSMRFPDQMAHVLRSLFTDSLTLTCAVNVMVIPFLLYTFQSFPVLGAIYNCFFPFLVSIAMGFAILCCILFWIPYISSGLFYLLHGYVDWILGIVIHGPPALDVWMKIEPFPLSVLISFLCAAGYVGMALHIPPEESNLFDWI